MRLTLITTFAAVMTTAPVLAQETWVAHKPEVAAANAAVRAPLEAYLRGHAAGDAAQFRQAFHDDAGTRFIEINPRFGGASNLSIQAGLASPERILQMARGQDVEAARPRAIAYGLTMLRYSQDRIVTDAELAAL